MTTVHLINHTHWDREWFLISVYTSRWIPRLIDKLTELVADNQSYLPAIPENLHLQEFSSKRFARNMSGKIPKLPFIKNELNSGKYGATFPGTLSARTY